MTQASPDRRRFLQAAFALPAAWAVTGRRLIGQEPVVASRPPSTAGRVEVAPVVIRLEPLTPDQDSPVVTAMAIDTAGEWLAVAGDDLSIRILDAAGLGEQDRLMGHRDLIRSLSFRGDGEGLASAGNDGRLLTWKGGLPWVLADRTEGLPALFRVRHSPDGKQLAAVGLRSDLMLIEDSGTERLPCRCADPRGLAYDETGQRLAVIGKTGDVWVLDPKSGASLNESNRVGSRLRDVAFLPTTDKLVTAGEDGAVTVVDLSTGKVLRRIDLLPCKLFVVAVIDATTIATAGSDNRIRIVDCESGKVFDHLDGHSGSISSLAFAAGYLFSGGYDTTVRRWRLGDRQSQRVAGREPSEGPNR